MNIRAAHVVNGRPATDYQVPETTIGSLLSERVQARPNKIFLIHYDSQHQREEWSYTRFQQGVHQAAHFLYHELGIRKGDRVATLCHNHSETVMITFACWVIGAAVAPQNLAEDDRRIAYILGHSEAVVCLVHQDYLDRAETIIHGTEPGLGAANIRQIVQVGGHATPAYVHFNTRIKVQPSALFIPTDSPTREDEALLVYTSGTTGAPKGVVLTQYNLMADAQGIAQWQGITSEQRLMCVVPLHHVNGLVMMMMTPLYAGASVVLNRAFSTSTFWQRICAEQVQVVAMVPTMLQFCLDYADQQTASGGSVCGNGIEPADLTSLRHLLCAAGTLSMSLLKAFQARFQVPVLHGYGLSETTCYSCFMPLDLSAQEQQHWLFDFGYPSIGCAIGPNEVSIFSSDGLGHELEAGQKGEICIRGHNVMKGYFKRPDANADTFRFGWFRSGDEGFYQQDDYGRRYFFITGRMKELINRGGVKFSPFDIEEVLLEIPGVKIALAVGFRNRYYGEEVGAYIVPAEGKELDADAIIAYSRTRMPFEKSPKVVVFGDAIPITSTGKVQRLKLHPQFTHWEDTQFKP